MAEVKGAAVTYTPETVYTYENTLAALYAYFDGTDPNWSIDTLVTIPTEVTTVGDQGFVIKNTAGDQVAIARDALVGGLMLDGGAISSSDDLIAGVCPGGGITDITSGGWAVGARWSGWAADCQAVPSATDLSGRLKVHSDEDWVFIRFKRKITNVYAGGIFAGKMDRIAARETGLFEGWCLLGGLFTDWSATSSNDHGSMEVNTGVWHTVRACPADATGGFDGDYASDGLNHYTISRVMLVAGDTTSSPGSNWTTVGPVGFFPCIYFSAQGTLGKLWDTLYVNMNAGCWMVEDDQTDAE